MSPASAHRFSSRFVQLFISALLILAASLPVLGQDTVTIPRKEFEQLKQQAAEAEQLRLEVDQLRAELSRNKQAVSSPVPRAANPGKASGTPATVASPVAAPATSPATTVATPAPRAEPLPPLKAGELLDVTDMLRQFAGNQAAAAKLYDGETIKLQGVIAGFDKPALRRDYEIVFRTADGQLVCRVLPPPSYSAVFTTQSGAVLTARNERGTQWDLMKIGDVVTIEGRGDGWKDGSVRFTRCAVLSVR